MAVQWQLLDDGTFSLVCGEVSLGPCYPAMDGEALHPISVQLARTPAGGTIRYTLSEGRALELHLGHDTAGVYLDTTLSGFTRLPWRIAPMAGQLQHIEQLFVLGLGFSGPSGWHTLNPAGQGSASAQAWLWSPDGTTRPLGELSSLPIQLQPHESLLYLFGPPGAPPPSHLAGD